MSAYHLPGVTFGPQEAKESASLDIPEPFNNEILQTLLEFLPNEDLKNYRLVSKKWAEVSTGILIGRKAYYFNVDFLRYAQSLEEIPGRNKSGAPELQISANELENLLLNSPIKFPAAGLILSSLWFLENALPSLKIISKNFGSKIRMVKIGYVKFNDPLDFSRRFLQQLTNLEEIEIDCYSWTRSKERYVACGKKPFELPSVKIISFGSDIEWMDSLKMSLSSGVDMESFEQLMMAATNLKEFKNFPLPLIPAAIGGNKIHGISDLAIKISDSGDFLDEGNLNKLSQSFPRIRNLEVQERLEMSGNMENFSRNIIHEVSQGLSTLLGSCSETLENITIRCSGLGFVDSITYPTLPNVTSLTVISGSGYKKDGDQVDWILPNLRSLSGIFPSLRKIKIKCDYLPGEIVFYSRTLLGGSALQYVEVLETSCPYDLEGMTILGSYFPNLTQLIISWRAWYLGKDARAIWLVPFRLKKLEMYGVPLSSGQSGSKFQMDLDSYFTGLEEERCVELRESLNYIGRDVSRVYPSLVDLESLEELKIHFSTKNLRNENITLSEVSGLFGFKLLPALKVLFLGSFADMPAVHLEVLRALSPYATFWNTTEWSTEMY